jgi:S-methylmethionine-dependent homocysteine/selenocysteine methylase
MNNGRLTALLRRPGIRLLDGAMGTELQRRGVDVSLPLWSARALQSAPEIVLQIHRDYIDAGADIITTNTFRTTSRTFRRAGECDRSAELTRTASSLARQAASETHDRWVCVAGSMAPLEDCYRPDLVPPDSQVSAEHAIHAHRLAECGVDLLLLETMGTAREAIAASRAAAATGLEFIVSFLCSPDGTLYGGESLADTAQTVAALGATALSLNCISPRLLQPSLSALMNTTSLPVAVYANVGRAGGERGGFMEQDVTPEEYEGFARAWMDQGVAIVGGCCGTTPAYIELMRDSTRVSGT